MFPEDAAVGLASSSVGSLFRRYLSNAWVGPITNELLRVRRGFPTNRSFLSVIIVPSSAGNPAKWLLDKSKTERRNLHASPGYSLSWLEWRSSVPSNERAPISSGTEDNRLFPK
eukprot:Gb_18643 [translate_table: standard]